ncbi:MAG: hypothetical protein JNL18_12705 [Planctomycetaceae bacterium]|nr:hypothetical protein [Planctomycetaceae bacterium]
MQFGMYLVDNGLLSTQAFYKALKLQMRSRPQLGTLAIETRRLTVKQMFTILQEQCDTPQQLFGEIAIRLGYLTNEDLNQLLEEQARHMASLPDVLVEHGFLSADVVNQQYATYRHSSRQAEPELELTNA